MLPTQSSILLHCGVICDRMSLHSMQPMDGVMTCIQNAAVTIRTNFPKFKTLHVLTSHGIVSFVRLSEQTAILLQQYILTPNRTGF
jgi:3-deoxy-D-manno-octulosonate 8-phosphate phosphatase KdsC-like HAD superfamily phosphatase